MRIQRFIALAVALAAVLGACGSDDGPSATFTAPSGGAQLAGSIAVTMAADGITIEEAGEARSGAGHFHVIASGGCLKTGEPIPRDLDHVHFGKGQSEGRIYLGPGEHELCLQVGDGVHAALAVTDTVKVNVGVTSEDQWCQVVEEVDEMFYAADTGDLEFSAFQAAYANIQRLLDQLNAGLAVLDADARDGLAEMLTFTNGMTEIVLASADMAEFEAAMATFWDNYPEIPPVGIAWISEHCGIDI